LGQVLVRCELVQRQSLDALLAQPGSDPALPLAARLVDGGFVGDSELVDCLRRECGFTVVDPARTPVPPEVLSLLPAATARRHLVVPLELSGSTVTMAMSDPTDLALLHELKFMIRYDVRPALASVANLRTALIRHYPPDTAAGNDVAARPATVATRHESEVPGEDAPVIRLVHAILADAAQQGASDIHIEPTVDSVRVRYRLDGALHDTLRPPGALRNAIASRIKILGDLDIAERRLPQDGRLRLPLPTGGEIDVRISVLPTLHGEKIVLRLLDPRRVRLDLSTLGMEVQQVETLRQALQRPHGMILVTGPTGSGKTTTLYAALAELNHPSRNILTAENPIEFELAGINQLQTNDDIGLDFATALRAFLRQDPDVIMLGEIRDAETASIAVKAAMTGHLVLSTLHTNDTAATITRLVDMGVAPYLVAASLSLVVAQRLVRRRCLHRVRDDADAVTQPTSCPHCKGSGFAGRLALYEMCPISHVLRDLILRHAAESAIRDAAHAEGMTTLREQGLRRAHEGLTSPEEVLRATS